MSRHTTLVLVRHGESNVSVERRFGGDEGCSGLSELGQRQAGALADRLARTGELQVDELWSSTLPRAIETATIVAPAIGDLEVRIERDLEELRPGPELDGTLFADYAPRFGQFDQRLEPDRPLAPGGESLHQFHERTARALGHLVDRTVGATVLVSCHGGVIDVAFRSFLGLAPTADFDLWTLNASITELWGLRDGDGTPTGAWVLGRYNDAAHLHGLPSGTRRGAGAA